METVRKGKVASETEKTEESIEEVEKVDAVEKVENMFDNGVSLENAQTLEIRQTFKETIVIAPQIYGFNPTAQEIAEFKEKEENWRKRLQSLI